MASRFVVAAALMLSACGTGTVVDHDAAIDARQTDVRAVDATDATSISDAPNEPDVTQPMCTGSASGQSSEWTCTMDLTARQRCVNGNVESEGCAHGCVAQPAGSDDVCAMDCAGSASGTSSVWSCTADHASRQRCISGAVQTEACAHGCVAQPLGTDDYCAPDCTGSASGTSGVWTCTADHLSRQRCVSGGVETEMCPGGCVGQPLGTDDYCATGCSASASGTSGIWTCTADHASRQRCVSGAVQTEACAHGCISQPSGTDDFCATSCSSSASGTSGIWTCTTDHTARQRCVSGSVQTDACMYGCVSQPSGTDDTCNASPPPAGSVSCAYPQWWNVGFSWSPGYYAIHGTYSWDNDLAVAAWTPVQLRHASRLERQGTYAWGWMPEFTDTVTGQRFALLHLQPTRRLTTTVGMVYPAGTLVGYSGGNTTETGYCVAIPGCGTANCGTATCVYSTGAHLCVQTQASYRTAFPVGTEMCR